MRIVTKKTQHTAHTPHSSTPKAEPFVGPRPGTVPDLIEDFPGVHPDVLRNDMSALD